MNPSYVLCAWREFTESSALQQIIVIVGILPLLGIAVWLLKWFGSLNRGKNTDDPKLKAPKVIRNVVLGGSLLASLALASVFLSGTKFTTRAREEVQPPPSNSVEPLQSDVDYQGKDSVQSASTESVNQDVIAPSPYPLADRNGKFAGATYAVPDRVGVWSIQGTFAEVIMPRLQVGTHVYLSVRVVNDLKYTSQYPFKIVAPVEDARGVRVLLPKEIHNTVDGKTFDLSNRIYKFTYGTDDPRFEGCFHRHIIMQLGDPDFVFNPPELVFCKKDDPGYELRRNAWAQQTD